MPRAAARPSVVAGTRGSQLALAQTRWVLERLFEGGLVDHIETKAIKTSGDMSSSIPRGDGAFVKEIERALLEGEIDLAVHSLKDMPTQPTPGLVIAAIPKREDPRDCLVGSTIAKLPEGARVGTGSPRRAARIRRLRNDLQAVAIRGNVPTRIEKARNSEVDAVVLALAGLRRLGLADPDEMFDARTFLPAPGQGALSVQIRSDDKTLYQVVSDLDDPDTRAAVTAEREVLSQLGGGCMLPIGVYAVVKSGELTVVGGAVAEDGLAEVRASSSGSPALATAIAAHVAEQLVEMGALGLMKVAQ